MSDFDDLIPRSRPAMNPTLDNPFEDPFADVVRPRSPDPWSMAASYYQQPYVPEADPEAEHFESVAVAHTVTETPAIESSSAREREELDTPRAKSEEVDPLDASSSSKSASEETPLRRNPLGPLPVVPREPTRQQESISQPTVTDGILNKLQALTEEPNSPAASISNPVSSSLSPPDEGQPAGVAISTQDVTEISPHLSSIVHPVSLPSLEPSGVPSPTSERYPSTSISVPHVSPSSPVPHSNSASSLSQENAENTTPHYDRIVSPLQSPYNLGSHMPLDQSFSGLALGGEAPGWGNASSIASFVNAPALAQNTRSEDDDDDEDNKPLVRAQSLDAQSVTTAREGGLSNVSFCLLSSLALRRNFECTLECVHRTAHVQNHCW